MVSKQLQALASDWGFNTDQQIWGENHGYMMAVEDGRGVKLMTVAYSSLTDEQRGALERFMDESKAIYAVQNYAVGEKMLAVQIKDSGVSGKVGVQRVIDFWQALLPVLNEKDVHGAKYCAICGEGIDGALDSNTVRINQMVARAHHACVDQIQQEAETANDAFHSEKKNYIAGFFGALVGALVATIPWILVQHFTGFLASALGLLIGMGAYKGYKIFGGKDGKATVWMIIFSTVVAVAFTQIAMLGIVMVENNIPLLYENFAKLLSYKELTDAMLGDLAIGYLMAGIGIFATAKKIHRSGKGCAPSVEILE